MALRNNFRATKRFLIAKFDCTYFNSNYRLLIFRVSLIHLPFIQIIYIEILHVENTLFIFLIKRLTKASFLTCIFSHSNTQMVLTYVLLVKFWENLTYSSCAGFRGYGIYAQFRSSVCHRLWIVCIFFTRFNWKFKWVIELSLMIKV